MSFEVIKNKGNNPKGLGEETDGKKHNENLSRNLLAENLQLLETETAMLNDLLTMLSEGNFASLKAVNNDLFTIKIDLPTGIEKQLFFEFIQQIMSFKNEKIKILRIVNENC